MTRTSAFLNGDTFSLTLTTPTLTILCSPVHIIDFYSGGRKTGKPGKNPLWHEREQHKKQTQFTYDNGRSRIEP